MCKKKLKTSKFYLSTKKLIAALSSSSEDSDFDFATFCSKTFKKQKRKLQKPTLKRSKREGMCLCEGDDLESSESDECVENNKTKVNTEEKQSKNIIFIEDDNILEEYMFTL